MTICSKVWRLRDLTLRASLPVCMSIMFEHAPRGVYEAHHIRARRRLKRKRFLAGRGFAEPSA